MTTLFAGNTEIISTYTPSSVASFNIQDDITSDYDDYIIEGRFIDNSVRQHLILKYSSDNGDTDYFNLKFFQVADLGLDPHNHNLFSTTGGDNILAAAFSNNGPLSFSISLKGILISQRPIIRSRHYWQDQGGRAINGVFCATDDTAKTINAVQLSASIGLLIGEIHLKGIIK